MTDAPMPAGDNKNPWLLTAYPSIMIGIFFLIPFILIVAVSNRVLACVTTL